MKYHHIMGAVLFLLVSCRSSGDPAATGRSEPVVEKHDKGPQPLQVQFSPDEVVKKTDSTPPASDNKNETVTALIREDDSSRPPTFADVVRLQKAVVANNRASEVERGRLAVLHLLAQELLASEEALDTLKLPMDPFLDLASFYLSDNLGEHKEAEDRLNKFMDQRRTQKGLTIDRGLLCESVKGYRQYVPSPTSMLRAGSVALVYIELHDFTLQKNQDRYTMHLRFLWELLDEKGNPMAVEWMQKVRPEEREMVAEFNDTVYQYHQNFKFPLPQNLPMGKYAIKITAEDVSSGKKASTDVEFHIQARQ